jgi:hypothetical protein
VVRLWILAVIAANGLTLALIAIVAPAAVSLFADLARAARQFRDELGGLTAEISREAARASDRTAQLGARGRGRRS